MAPYKKLVNSEDQSNGKKKKNQQKKPKKQNKEQSEGQSGDLTSLEPISEVLIFPDTNLICQKTLSRLLNGNKDIRCDDSSCDKVHGKASEAQSSLLRFLLILDEAKESVDVCVYIFTHYIVANLLCKLQARGVRVRVVANRSEEQVVGCQLDGLQRRGIPIKINKSDSQVKTLMHHKFVIIDKRLLMSGSFNYTYAAVNKNNESVTVTSEPKTLAPFIGEFEKMWSSFVDRKLTTDATGSSSKKPNNNNSASVQSTSQQQKAKDTNKLVKTAKATTAKAKRKPLADRSTRSNSKSWYNLFSCFN